jgi:hypothetical protein
MTVTREDIVANLGLVSWEELMFALARKMHALGYPENAIDYLLELEDHIEAGLSSLNSVERADLEYRMDNLKRSLT